MSGAACSVAQCPSGGEGLFMIAVFILGSIGWWLYNVYVERVYTRNRRLTEAARRARSGGKR